MSHNPRDHAQHPHRAPEGAATDSHQVPWAGRELSASGFEHDAGAADPALVVALADPERDAVAEQRLVEAVAGGRLIIPIVAEPAEVDASGELVVETRVEMAAVTLVAPDGQRALPVFSGVGALAAWDPAARPVPVTPARAAQAARAFALGARQLDPVREGDTVVVRATRADGTVESENKTGSTIMMKVTYKLK